MLLSYSRSCTGIGGDRADEIGYLSQRRAAAAWAQGRIVLRGWSTGLVESEGGELVSVARDEGPRETSLEGLAELKPVRPDGIDTAGTTSQVADGASAVLLMTEERRRVSWAAVRGRAWSTPAWSAAIRC